MPFKARKKFIVVCYDVTKTKLRNKVADELGKFGKRANYSVFECMLTDTQFKQIKTKLGNMINSRTDKILYYQICVDCFTKITKQPETDEKASIVLVG
jgi:CRISPR-associated protein Cas2